MGDDRAAAESELLAKVRDGLDRREIVHRTFLDSFSRYRTTDDIGISHFAVRAADGPAAASPLVTVPAFDRAEFERKLAFLRELRTDDRLGRGPGGVVGLRIEVSGPAADAPDTQSPPFTPDPAFLTSPARASASPHHSMHGSPPAPLKGPGPIV